MIAVDTNLLIRLILLDDPKQLVAVQHVLQHNKLFISTATFVEIAWVLSTKNYQRPEIAGALQFFLNMGNTIIPSREALSKAVDLYSRGKADFVDYLIQAEAMFAGATSMVTFDKTLLREQPFCQSPEALAS